MPDASLLRLSQLLEQVLSDDVEREVVQITAQLYKEQTPYRWLFLLICTCFVRLLDQPGPIDALRIEPVIEQMKSSVQDSLAAIEHQDLTAVCSSANGLAEAFSHLCEIDAD
jgi:hypothetical protein